MIGTKIYKTDFDAERYAECANYCNETRKAIIEDKGDYYECIIIPAPSLEQLKSDKITSLKSTRDSLEVEYVSYNGNLFDFDEKSRDRINSAIIALSISNQSIEWTTADNTNVLVTADDLRGVIANFAVRSNELHVKYRELKTQVEAAETAEELEAIVW